MLRFILGVTSVLGAYLEVNLLGATAAGGKVERRIAKADGTEASMFTNRASKGPPRKTTRHTAEISTFFPTDSYETLCTAECDAGSTDVTSPYVEDCAYILSHFLYEVLGWWDLEQLLPGEDYPLLQHNTCSLYYQVPQGYDSLQ
jgi:hypothetical protein